MKTGAEKGMVLRFNQQCQVSFEMYFINYYRC